MFNWPENILPLPSYNFNVTHDASTLRTKLETGRTLQRKRYSGENETANVKFDLTQQEYALFKGVWVSMLNQGADWFTMRLPIADGADLTETDVRFITDYKATHMPVGNWDITASIEFKETGSLSPEAINFLIDNNFTSVSLIQLSDFVIDEVSHFKQHSFE